MESCWLTLSALHCWLNFMSFLISHLNILKLCPLPFVRVCKSSSCKMQSLQDKERENSDFLRVHVHMWLIYSVNALPWLGLVWFKVLNCLYFGKKNQEVHEVDQEGFCFFQQFNKNLYLMTRCLFHCIFCSLWNL